MKENFGLLNSPESFRLAEEKVEKYNEKMGDEFAKVVQKDSGEFMIVVCDSLSRRVSEYVPQSGDILFMDATSNIDRGDSKFFRLITPSPAGGLPVGYMILSSEKEEIITEALQLFQTILPSNAFFKRGPILGPRLFLTDDADSEINSLKNVFPNSISLLCHWHMKQAIWRYLCLAKHEIHKTDRQLLFRLFNDVINAKTKTAFDAALDTFLQDETVQKYENFISHVERSYLNRIEKWALFYRLENGLTTHGNDNNNFCESSFRILKDVTFNRTKAYNICELIEILLSDDSSYYRQKLVQIGNGTFSQFDTNKSRYKSGDIKIRKDQVAHLEEFLFMVESERDPNVVYTIDMRSGFCSCFIGQTLAPCKHKASVAKYFKISHFSVLPEFDACARSFYHFLANGSHMDQNWYRPIDNPDGAPQFSQYVEHETDENSDKTLAGDDQTQHENTNENSDDSLVGDDQNYTNIDGDDSVAGDDQIYTPTEHDETSSEISDEDHMQETNDDIPDFEEKFAQLTLVINGSFRDNLAANWADPTTRKCLDSFITQVTKSKSNVETQKRSMYGYGREVATKVKSGKKTKKGKVINVQPTAVMRREHRHRGRSAAVSGRKPHAAKQAEKLKSREMKEG